MRTSQIALLSAVGVILLVIVAVAVAVRIAIADFSGDFPADAAVTEIDFGDTATTSLGLDGFSGIVIDTSWRVELVQADSWRVDVSYPENLDAGAAVTVRDGRLMLNDAADRRASSWWSWGGPDQTHTARISMPRLDEVVVHGAADIDMSGFNGQQLVITVSGAGNIQARNSKYDELSLVLSGASNIDFRSLRSVDADVQLSGASNVRLAMNGGELTGQLSGFGYVTYSGDVSSERIDVSGFGRVKQTGIQHF